MTRDGQLPDALRSAIARETAAVPPGDLRRAAQALSDRYRTGGEGPPRGLDQAGRLAYLATRLPATFAAASAVLDELAAALPALPVRRLLDLGAGPGTVAAAAFERFESLDQAILIEGDTAFAGVGERILASVTPSSARVEWRRGDAAAALRADDEPFDLVAASYLIGELTAARAGELITSAWRHCRGAFAIVEPGTPSGFTRILAARAHLLALGARIAAPCPHDGPCPLASPDWCHFAARLNRSAQHRWLKGGSAGYEDEKYSYVVASRLPALRDADRIIDRPDQHKGFVNLRLCSADGLRLERVTRKDSDAWRAARRARWGGQFRRDLPSASQ